MLNGIKILDLTLGGAGLCGHLLADMGASVQHWFAQSLLGEMDVLDAHGQLDNASMRAWCINQQCAAVDWAVDPDRLRALLPNVDVLLHDRTDAQLQALGLDPRALSDQHPALLVVSMTAFGAAGPKADFAATDLIALAASGHLAVSGAADRAPVRIRTPQAFAHAAADGAVGVMLGLAARQTSGRGQRLDVSAAQSTTLATLSRSLDGAVGQGAPQRAAYGTALGGIQVRNQYALADGWALVLPGVLPPLAAFMQRLMEWVHASGHCGDWVLTEDWGAAGMKLATGGFAPEQWAELEDAIAAQLAGLTKAEVMAVAVERRLLIAPIMSVADLLASDHAQARGLVVQSEGRSRLGPFAHFERTPLPLAPMAPADWQAPVSQPVANTDNASSLPLAGLKVLDMFWVVAGPGATRMLADYGATVIHVETRKRLDMVRNVPPYIDGVAEPERAACHHSTNTNKLNLSLDLSNPGARPVLEDLIRWADVVTESFAPGVAERLGFGLEQVRALNPKAIMISSCLMGQNGPWRDYAGYGNTAAAVSGFHALAGYAGQPPMGCFGPYTDFLSVRFNALAILAALRHRQASGEGQFIDMSQAEAALRFLAPECQRVFDGDFDPALQGNADPTMTPHGVYPAAGDDQWLAVAVANQSQWQALCNLLQQPQWVSWELPQRQQQSQTIDDCLAQWTADHSAASAQEQLQKLGIPAHAVLDTEALFADSQLQHREHFVVVDHALHDGAAVESTRLRFSDMAARTPTVAPSFGCDNETVLKEQLGYSAQLYAELDAAAVLQ